MGFPKQKKVGRRRVRSTRLDPIPEIGKLVQAASELYNQANYHLKSIWLHNRYLYRRSQGQEDRVIAYSNPSMLLEELQQPSYPELDKPFQKQDNYRALPSVVAQQTLMQVSRDWKAFWKSTKAFAKDPSKFNGRPQTPGYKKHGPTAVAVFTKGSFRLEMQRKHRGLLNLPAKTGIPPIPIRVFEGQIQEVRIRKDGARYWLDCIYFLPNPQTINQRKQLTERLATIDLGVDNLLTLLDDSALQQKAKACIIDGRTLKSRNQWFNKRIAELQAKLPQGQKTSHQIQRLFARRNRWMKDYMHKATRLVADCFYENDVTEAVIGYNPGWKQEVELGGAGNQRFVQIPYLMLIQMLEYKLFDYGIPAIRQEESYTSKTDHFAGEPMKHIVPNARLGRRVHRGLFQSSTGAVINADVNGCIGTGRKRKGERWTARFTIANSGVAPTPVRIGVWQNPSAQSRRSCRATNEQARFRTAAESGLPATLWK